VRPEKCLCPVCGAMFEEELPHESLAPMVHIGSMRRKVVPCFGKHSLREIWQAWRNYYRLEEDAA
jgi:hypothetical protein